MESTRRPELAGGGTGRHADSMPEGLSRERLACLLCIPLRLSEALGALSWVIDPNVRSYAREALLTPQNLTPAAGRGEPRL